MSLGADPMSMLPTTTTNDDGLKNSLVFSAVLHLFLLVFLYFGLPIFFKPPEEYHPPVPFEIVEIADITNTRTKDEPEPQKQPQPEPPKPEPPKPEAAQPQQPAPAQPAPPTPVPPPPKPPEPQAEALKPAPAPPKPKPPDKVQQQTQADFTKLLKNLETTKPALKTVETKTESKTTTPAVAAQAPSLSSRVTISEQDALRRQIEQCWNPDPGIKNAQNMVVELVITVNPDRTVQSAEVVDKGRMASDSYYRSAAEAALRAVRNPRCSPLELPPDKYEDWKKITFDFDPRDLI